MSLAPQALPADRIADSWVERAPMGVRPYLRLMRLDRPIGTWLLFLPCVFGAALGTKSFGSPHDLLMFVQFAVGALVMRGAGCTYNDIVDRDIDAQVVRTRDRPIPSGAVSVRHAWIFLAVQCMAGLVILLQLNLFSIALGVASLALIAIYPFMKRVTWWPQAWLGLTFNWGALLGFAAQHDRIAIPALLLYAGCFFWTLGYDTIYAHQDKDDDALIGVKSTARLFGTRSRAWITAFYALTVVFIAAALFAANGRWLPLLLLVPAALHLFWQVRTLDVNDGANCLKRFRANRDTGLLIAAAIIASGYTGS
jgi:4-hydroxybenzoate polyprenyltransferase